MFEKFSEMKKTSGKRPKIKSEVLSTEEITQGSETKVLQAELKYKEGKIVEGFVYKKIHQSDVNPTFGKLEMEDRLHKWGSIKKVKKELLKSNEKGFNIPGTIRGYQDEEGAGI